MKSYTVTLRPETPSIPHSDRGFKVKNDTQFEDDNFGNFSDGDGGSGDEGPGWGGESKANPLQYGTAHLSEGCSEGLSEMAVMEASPVFMHRMNDLTSQCAAMKKTGKTILESTNRYLKAQEEMVRAGRSFAADLIVNDFASTADPAASSAAAAAAASASTSAADPSLSPGLSAAAAPVAVSVGVVAQSTDMLITGANSAANLLVRHFQELLIYHEVLQQQQRTVFVEPLTKLVDESRAALESKKVFDRAYTEYSSALDSYCGMSKDTDAKKLTSKAVKISQLHAHAENARIAAVRQLHQVCMKRDLFRLDSLVSLIYVQLFYFGHGHQLLVREEPWLTHLFRNLSRGHVEILKEQRKMMDNYRLRQGEEAKEDESSLQGASRGAVSQRQHTRLVRKHMRQTTKEGGVALSGYLLKRSTNVRKDWKRRWFVLERGRMFYMRNPDDLEAAAPVDLTLATVKIPTGKDIKVRFCFEVVTMPPRGQPRTMTLQASSMDEMNLWIGVIGEAVQEALDGLLPSSSSGGKGGAGGGGSVEDDVARIIARVRTGPGNGTCADCGSPEPVWASINLGVVVCIACSGVHRAMGTHISKVRSMTLDTRAWDEDMLNMMCAVGNTRANRIWEGAAAVRDLRKPNVETPRPEREQWIRSKYEGAIVST